MEKSRMRPVPAGKSLRMSFSRQKEVLEMPNLIEIQKNSYQWFLDEGLKEVFEDISPIADFAGHLSLEFVDFTLCKDDIKYTIEECKERDATYAAPLKVKVRLCNKDKDEINEHEIFMGDLPLMTDTGSFVINGAERVIVSQLVRSPGIYYGIGHDKVGKELYTCTVIPNRGAWLEYETDSNDIFYVRVDRTRKVPVTVLIRALGFGTNAEIIELFGEEPKLLASFGKDTSDNYQDGLLELYKKIRPGEPLSVDSAESLLNSMFFDPRRYDLAKVGRYKFNKKLHFKNRIVGHVLSEDVVDTTTGEILATAGTTVDKQLAVDIQNAAVPYVWVAPLLNISAASRSSPSSGLVLSFILITFVFIFCSQDQPDCVRMFFLCLFPGKTCQTVRTQLFPACLPEPFFPGHLSAAAAPGGSEDLRLPGQRKEGLLHIEHLPGLTGLVIGKGLGLCYLSGLFF